jgi:hypothetical protein
MERANRVINGQVNILTEEIRNTMENKALRKELLPNLRNRIYISTAFSHNSST